MTTTRIGINNNKGSAKYAAKKTDTNKMKEPVANSHLLIKAIIFYGFLQGELAKKKK